MEIKILCPLWGYEDGSIEVFMQRIADAGFDGVEAWLPENIYDRLRFLDLVQQHEFLLITHQYQASGDTFEEFKTSFLNYLDMSSEGDPLFINSHTGKDYFSFEQNLELVDLAQSFSNKRGVDILHETHRGRFSYSPMIMYDYLKIRPELKITADFSHWTCVTESFLDDFSFILKKAMKNTRHIHARIGYEEGPQIPDPRDPEWKYAMDHFFEWWDEIVNFNLGRKQEILTFTTEFGPYPYLLNLPFSKEPIADQFEINCFMKDLLSLRYRDQKLTI